MVVSTAGAHGSRTVIVMIEYTNIQTARKIICDMCNRLYPADNCPDDCDWMECLIEGAADVIPLAHGRWIWPHWRNSDYCCVCSNCGGEAMHREYQWNKKGIYPLCPNCGARMDGE